MPSHSQGSVGEDPDKLVGAGTPDPPQINPLAVLNDIPQDNLPMRRSSVYYSEELAEYILDRYISGVSLLTISDEPGMPSYGSMCRWLKDNDDFADKFEIARRARALYHEEKALEVATDPDLTKNDVPAARLAFDAHVWAARVKDQDRFGNKTIHSGDKDRPLTFLFNTGVPAPTKEQEPPQLDDSGKIIEAQGREVSVTDDEDGEPYPGGTDAATTSEVGLYDSDTDRD